jgi:hypothetical protein
MAILSTVTSIIVYTPLIIICLSVLSGIGYGVWHVYARGGTLPPSYVYVGGVILVILIKILTPLKLLGQLLWFIFPITPTWRASLNTPTIPPTIPPTRPYSPWGAWDPANILKSSLILFFGFIIGLTTLIYKHGYPDTINGYSKFLNGSILSIEIIGVIVAFIIFSETIRGGGLGQDLYATATTPGAQRAWLFNNTKAYLYYLIGTGLAL